ncbi:MAG TPA: type II toxin-antitoxin system RelE/ParE family toxin [Steroidobacteraceae bacterium]|nr:type II toxin-antitoxin system RelE/ParE family toxin [Steroidobacteraceae bacterium]
MTPKVVVPRARAERDVDEAIDYYLSENAPEAALGFIDALEKAYSHIGRHPDAGTSRYAGDLSLPGLRFWRLKKYPHVIFYVERSNHIDVWRVLHGMRDIPTWMQDPDLI